MFNKLNVKRKLKRHKTHLKWWQWCNVCTCEDMEVTYQELRHRHSRSLGEIDEKLWRLSIVVGVGQWGKVLHFIQPVCRREEQQTDPAVGTTIQHRSSWRRCAWRPAPVHVADRVDGHRVQRRTACGIRRGHRRRDARIGEHGICRFCRLHSQGCKVAIFHSRFGFTVVLKSGYYRPDI